MAGAVGSKISFCETLIIFDFGHDDDGGGGGGDDSVWQVQHIGCFRLRCEF